MTHSHLIDLTNEYEAAFKKYDEILEKFFTTILDGDLSQVATKSFFKDEDLVELDLAKTAHEEAERRWRLAI